MTALTICIDTKTYDSHGHRHCAIADFRLQVEPHQFVCLVGPSGCGKTTLLNVVAGLDPQFQGQLVWGEGTSPSIGYVFQEPRLLPWRSVRQNIELVFRQPPQALIDQLLCAMQLDTVQHAYPERLSLGMQRRVAIIRAFAVSPDLLLMDEPFVSLDAATARQTRHALAQLWQQRPHTVLFVTHDLREAIALADRLLLLSAAPMRIIDDIAVPIARDRRDDEQQIEQMRRRIIQQYPDLAL